ncbi:MAG TPA: TonB-dependent receptor plug domain-containing protein, partial [Thermoanaerobaculia bacterium]|nr:TonB-dependent receptor plug domain-containing protein [Thermoanaerobaculia bacterium]
MKRLFLASLALAFATIAPRPAAAQPAPTPTPTASTEVVVTATKLPEDPVDVPGAVEVVTGDEIRRTNARTLADAIQDVAGVDIGTGS